jgi:hypothetical protein
VGVILFEMLTGATPVPGASVPSAVNRLLPREIDPVVAKALGRSGGYEAAATLAAELRAIGAVLEVRAQRDAADPIRVVTRLQRPQGMRRLLLALIVAALVLVAWWYLRPA